MVVVLTAPKPTSSTPNRPRAGAISTGADTGEDYISFSGEAQSGKLLIVNVPFNFFTRRGDAYALVVGMTGVKLGEQVAQLGCSDGGLLGAVAKRVGLSGRFVAYVPDQASAERARRGAADAGVLVDVEAAPSARVPANGNMFDIVLIDDTDWYLSGMETARGAETLREGLRILRPGGRLMVIGATGAEGLGRWLMAGRRRRSLDQEDALQANGFALARRLAERDGYIFIEAIRPREGP